MGESTQWTKKQKVSATQYTSTNAVCEDCGRKWIATLAEVPVTIFIQDLDHYYNNLKNNLLEAIIPPMVLCVFRPSDTEFSDTEDNLSCVAPLQESPYHWKINHKHKGPAATSGCQIIPLTDKELQIYSEIVSPEEEIVTIKKEVNDGVDKNNKEIDFDPFFEVQDGKPDINLDIKVEENPLVVTDGIITDDRIGHDQRLDTPNNITSKLRDNNKKSTVFGCGAFREWLEICNHSPEFEGFDKLKLASLLQRFYGEVRKQDGSRYCKQSMISIRANINRQLNCGKWARNFDIISDYEFKRANSVMEEIFKDLNEKGLDKTKSACPLTPEDFEKLIKTGTVGLDNPTSLQNLVWLSLCLQAQKDIKSWRDMKKDSFVEGIDELGRQYICFKNSNTSGSKPEATRVYEQDDNDLCPVKAYKMYISHLSPIDDLWQRPNKLHYKVTGVWYSAQPLGINKLLEMMKQMSQNAGLPIQHRNHCVKATLCTRLAEAGIREKDIVKVTGHKAVGSLKRYIAPTPSNTKRLHSSILSSVMLGNTFPGTSPTTTLNIASNSVSVSAPAPIPASTPTPTPSPVAFQLIITPTPEPSCS